MELLAFLTPGFRRHGLPAFYSCGTRSEDETTTKHSSRIQTITDPVNRQVQYGYDERDRNVTIAYGDTSTEKFYFGAQGSGNENLLVKIRTETA